MTKQKNKIPEFTSREEEAQWFDTHDLGDYIDEFNIVDSSQVKVESNLSHGITIRLTPEFLNKLRTKAKSKGIGPSTLARMWIIEHLRKGKEDAL